MSTLTTRFRGILTPPSFNRGSEFAGTAPARALRKSLTTMDSPTDRKGIIRTETNAATMRRTILHGEDLRTAADHPFTVQVPNTHLGQNVIGPQRNHSRSLAVHKKMKTTAIRRKTVCGESHRTGGDQRKTLRGGETSAYLGQKLRNRLQKRDHSIASRGIDRNMMP
jgi:hypothetical protein